MTKDDIIKLAREAGFADGVAEIVGLEGFANFFADNKKALKAALEQPEQEPMRMPTVGDKVICLEDESLGTVVSLTAGGSPDITFDDGSRGTYMLGEFSKLFGYVTPPAAQRPWVGLEAEEILDLFDRNNVYGSKWIEFARTVEAKLKEKNT
jgi:hypothetical protein